MSSLISETERNLLNEAVDSRDPTLIAKCVVAIDEICQVIKHIIRRDVYDHTHRQPASNQSLQLDGELLRKFSK